MKRTRINKLLAAESAGSECLLKGWVRTKRESKGICFIEVNDGSSMANIQVVAEEGIPGYAEIVSAGTGSSISVTGMLVDSPAQGQKFEVKASSLQVIGEAGPDYPLQKKRHTLEFLREISHLRPRTNTIGAVMRVRNALAFAVHSFFQERGFCYVHTPIITASDCEGAGEIFRVTTLPPAAPVKDGETDYSQDFFGVKTGLTVSGQLEGELLAMALGDIYTFGPTFRAENSNTSRHLSEFWMIEPEMAFAELPDDIELAGDFIRYLFRAVLDRCPAEMDFFNQRIKPGLIENLESIISSGHEVMTYTDAVKHLESSGENFEYPVKWGLDLQSEHERWLTEKLVKKPLFVINYPRAIKPFYMKVNDEGNTVAAMDLLVPGVGEIIGGSEREYRLDMLTDRMKETGITPEEYSWYIDTRRYGTVPHAGFGLGFERTVQFVTGMQNIRDVIPFPRYPGKGGF
jgi:asparaginyl-tRNA synthetase